MLALLDFHCLIQGQVLSQSSSFAFSIVDVIGEESVKQREQLNEASVEIAFASRSREWITRTSTIEEVETLNPTACCGTKNIANSPCLSAPLGLTPDAFQWTLLAVNRVFLWHRDRHDVLVRLRTFARSASQQIAWPSVRVCTHHAESRARAQIFVSNSCGNHHDIARFEE